MQNIDPKLPDFTPVGHVITHSCGHQHPIYAPDTVKAERMIERMREMGGTDFKASPDLLWMLVPKGMREARSYGFNMICTPDLPPNSLISAIGGEIVPAHSRA
jgi:hypothetical protein